MLLLLLKFMFGMCQIVPEYEQALHGYFLKQFWYQYIGSSWDIGFGPEDPRKIEDCGQVHAYVYWAWSIH